MKKIDIGHDGKNHIEITLGKFFIAWNEFLFEFGLHKPPYTAGVTVLRIGHFEIGYW